MLARHLEIGFTALEEFEATVERFFAEPDTRERLQGFEGRVEHIELD